MNEKDALVEQTINQRDAYRAVPEDFPIMREGEPAFHGQDSPQLRKQGAKSRGKSQMTGTAPRATSVDDAGAPKTDGIREAEGA